MKMKKILLIAAFITSLSATAQDKGNGSSGGGASVVCRDRDNHIVSAELLDTFEGVFKYNLNIVHTSEDINSQIEKALDQFAFDPFYKYTIIELIEHIKKKFQFLPEGISLNAPSDLGESDGVLVREGCRVEGLGYYNTAGNLKVAPATYNKLSKTDQAAFLLHEALYLYYRGVAFVWDSSEVPRHLNAMLFAQDISSEEIAELFINNYYSKEWNIVEKKILLPSERSNTGKLIVRLTPSNLLYEYQLAYSYNNFSNVKREYMRPIKGELVVSIDDDVAPLFMLESYSGGGISLKFNISIFRDDEKIYEIKDFIFNQNGINNFRFSFVHKPY
jgi:hypothetical protein